MAEGQRPLSVGFWFSLGHSTIVFGLGVLMVAGVRGLSGAVGDEGSGLQQATGPIGPLVSGTFLLATGLLNLVILVSIARIFRRLRRGEFDEAWLIGGIELLAVIADELGLTGGLWDLVGGIDLNETGYPVVALFALTWAIAAVVWRLGRIEERWPP